MHFWLAERGIGRELRSSEKTEVSSRYTLLISQCIKIGKASYESGRIFSKEELIELAWLAKQYSVGAVYPLCYCNCAKRKLPANGAY